MKIFKQNENKNYSIKTIVIIKRGLHVTKVVRQSNIVRNNIVFTQTQVGDGEEAGDDGLATSGGSVDICDFCSLHSLECLLFFSDFS